MKLYISGPIANMPERNVRAFNDAERLLRCLGFDIVNPVNLPVVPEWTHKEYLSRDIPLMLGCDGVATLYNPTDSRGMKAEMTTAVCCGMDVRPVRWWVWRKKLGKI